MYSKLSFINHKNVNMEIKLNSPYAAEQLKAQTILMEVIDPELNINIIDLGLIYALDFALSDKLSVTMTLTTAHCPMGDAIKHAVEHKLALAFPARTVSINLVWEPEWTAARMSDAAKTQLGFDR